VETLVLEKHADFLRDFRGDTVHPSTLQIMDELGLLDAFLERPHQEVRQLRGQFGKVTLQIADLERLAIKSRFIALMPQWDFLNFLAAEARACPAFQLRMEAEATALLHAPDGRVAGVRGSGKDGPFEVDADCTIACDGRHSTLRAEAALPSEDVGAPIDVLWFRVRRDPATDDTMLARIGRECFMVTIDRGDYWQCAFVIPKGGAETLRERGLEPFLRRVAEVVPALAPYLANDVKSWDDVQLLTVAVDRLLAWSRPGLLCIGDAAHAMSPIGGVGINLAIQDAVATANLLAEPLRSGQPVDDLLDAVRRRRLWPAKATQAVQVTMQDNVLVPVISGSNTELRVPLPMRLLTVFPPLQRLLARGLGMGLRPEHVETPRVAG
jgi:2-polyprenyl-6-methoxyphenol hydroxylase-like FAD-dependent oxidoreductase